MCLPATARSKTTDRALRLPEHFKIQCVCNFLAAVKNKTSHPSVRRAIKSINLITAATPRVHELSRPRESILSLRHLARLYHPQLPPPARGTTTACRPSFSSGTTLVRSRVRRPRSVPGSVGSIFGDNPRQDKISSPAKSRSQSVF